MSGQASKPEILKLTSLGNPILRAQANRLNPSEIGSKDIKELIASMRFTNENRKYGVGIAAPQVGESVALALIDIKPTKTRPTVPIIQKVIINPVYKGIGRRASMWEGCLSTGTGNSTLYARALRFRKINANWSDEQGKLHDEVLQGIEAHVFQHETDHVNGILFVDKVRDTSSYMLASEYKKRIVKRQGGA